MSPDVYKLVHVAGLLMVFMSLGGLALHGINGGTKDSNGARRLTTLTYGIGLLLILLGGFGWLGATGMLSQGVPGWTWAKLAIWLTIGALLAVPAVKPELSRLVWFVAPALGVLAAWLARTKPF
ncbi:MAG: hypothetical protein Q8W45_06895 [Candidatus Palauibacterales bacterium]|jgi:hypothetical protein|nr:hypothetical protein [Candidatus Palauibacterales bacterium]MDP2482991.1 hypothetical protein [Candidatus Palauibacterales bacterium]